MQNYFLNCGTFRCGCCVPSGLRFAGIRPAATGSSRSQYGCGNFAAANVRPLRSDLPFSFIFAAGSAAFRLRSRVLQKESSILTGS